MRVAGLTVGFTGVVILVWPRLAVRGDGGAAAVLAGLAAAVLYGIAANYTKRKLHGVHPLVIATGSLIAATALLLIPALLSWPDVTPRPASWLSAVVLGVLCTGVAYILYFRLLERVGAARTLAVTYLIPAFGVWWGYLFLDERITPNILAGCGVILLGTALATGAFTPRRSVAPLPDRAEGMFPR
jgi:drug/metabolite transporter (DMT)-like permease